MKISFKLQMITVSLILVFLGVLIFSVITMRTTVFSARNNTAKAATEIGYEVVRFYFNKYNEGIMTQQDAQLAALEQLKFIRYEGIEYFWVNNTTLPYPLMVMHSINESLDGKIMDNPIYNNIAMKRQKNLFQAFVEVGKNQGEGFIDYFWPRPGETTPVPKMSYVKLFPEWDWIIGTGVYVDVVNNEIKNVILTVAFTILFVIIISIILTYILNKKIIITPINKMTNSLKNISRGDGDLTAKIESKTKDEIGEMANNFNSFVDKLKLIVIKLKENTVQSSNVSHDLTAGVEETAAAINQIIANIASIQKQIQNVDNSVVSTGAAVEQITENIEKLEKEIETQASMVEESSASITQMMSSLNSVANITEKKTEGVKQLEESAIRGKEQLDLTNKTFKESVVARMDAIQEMAKTIESIANQTNLLSMNAAIEAAHAGEYGNGFAVVAEEIRKLADNSARSSKEISLILKQVMNGVNETGASAQATSVEFEKILLEVKDTKNALQEINSNTRELTIGGSEIIKAVEELNTVTSNIKISSLEISENSKKILVEQQNLTNISATVASGTSEIQSGSAEIGDAMQLVSELNHKLKEIVSSIKEETDKFKV